MRYLQALRNTILLILTTCVLAGVSSSAGAMTVAAGWQLDFKPGPLRLFKDPDSGQSYWYMTYVVTNTTGQDLRWAPSMELFYDDGRIMLAGRGVPGSVTKQLLTMLGNPLLQDQNQILGELLQGKEHAKEGLAVWVADTNTQGSSYYDSFQDGRVIWNSKVIPVTELSFFLTGASSQTEKVRNPITRQEVVLRKTLRRDFVVPGNYRDRGSEPVTVVSDTWIMR